MTMANRTAANNGAETESFNNNANRDGVVRPVSGYEEFFGGSIQCPSCRGTGRISRESENELVALIPVRDKRLKPRRTSLYVSLSIIICCTIAALLVFFLYPRGFSVDSDDKNLIPSALYINKTESLVKMTVTNVYNISNPNFFQMSVANLSGQVFFDQRIMAQTKNTTAITVPMRSMHKHYLTFNVTFDHDEGYIAYYCSEGPRFGHSILMPFETKVSASIMGKTEELTVTSYHHVKCSPADMSTTKTPKTKPTTVTDQPPTVTAVTYNSVDMLVAVDKS